MVWGFMLMRPTPAPFRARSFSIVRVSGRPASTVNSRQCSMGKVARILPQSFESCSALRVVGVPPPIYTDMSRSPSSPAISAARSSSRSSSSR